MATDRIAAGYNRMWYGVVDSNGDFLGSSTTAPTAGAVAGSGMVRLDGARTLPVSISEPEVLVVSGDDEPLVSFEFDAEELPSGLFEMAVRDTAFEALAQGTKVQTIATGIEMSILDPAGRLSQGLCFFLWRRAKSWLSGEKGAKKRSGLYIAQATVKPLGNVWEQRVFNAYGYAINLSRSDQLGWTTVNNSEHGTCAASMFPFDTDYDVLQHRHTGDGATSAYTLPYALVSGGSYAVYVNDVYDSLATVTGTTVDFSGSSAPASSAKVVTLWEIDESAIC
jgi:hypothetical protein